MHAAIVTSLLLKIKRTIDQARIERSNQLLQSNGSQGVVAGLVELKHPEHIYLGGGSYVNGGMLCASKYAKIRIGKNCMVSYNVHMRTDMHRYDSTDVPMIEQGHREANIIIGDDVWIGFGAQIMAGITVGSHAVVGAGAVVTRDVPEWAVVGGVPARIIKMRK